MGELPSRTTGGNCHTTDKPLRLWSRWQVSAHERPFTLTLRAPRGGSKTTLLGFSSVVFARGMILKRILANQTLIISGYGGKIKYKTLPKILVGERCNNEGIDGNLLQNIVF